MNSMKEKNQGLVSSNVSPTMQEIMKSQITDIRDRISNYRVVANRQSHKLNYDPLPHHIDILLFGPAGSGKSSLIRTFYRSLN